MFSASDVKELREKTGAGMMDCKKALEACEGNQDKAVDWLREKGIAKAAKKAGRIAAEGLVESYIHGDGRIGVLVEVNIETDFAAKNPEFREFVKDVAMQIAAMRPLYLDKDSVPEERVEKERAILTEQAENEGLDANKLPMIVNGRLGKFYEEVCLLEQGFVKENKMKVSKYVESKGMKVLSFVRYEVGEGMEKKEENFADEVAKQING